MVIVTGYDWASCLLVARSTYGGVNINQVWILKNDIVTFLLLYSTPLSFVIANYDLHLRFSFMGRFYFHNVEEQKILRVALV